MGRAASPTSPTIQPPFQHALDQSPTHFRRHIAHQRREREQPHRPGVEVLIPCVDLRDRGAQRRQFGLRFRGHGDRDLSGSLLDVAGGRGGRRPGAVGNRLDVLIGCHASGQSGDTNHEDRDLDPRQGHADAGEQSIYAHSRLLRECPYTRSLYRAGRRSRPVMHRLSTLAFASACIYSSLVASSRVQSYTMVSSNVLLHPPQARSGVWTRTFARVNRTRVLVPVLVGFVGGRTRTRSPSGPQTPAPSRGPRSTVFPT